MSRPALRSRYALTPQLPSPTAFVSQILGLGFVLALASCTGEASATTDIPPASESSDDYECVVGGLGCACSEVGDCEPGLTCMAGVCGGEAKPPTSAGVTSDGTDGTGTTATSTGTDGTGTTEPTTGTGASTTTDSGTTTEVTTSSTTDVTGTTTELSTSSTTDATTTDASTTDATTTTTGTSTGTTG